MMTATQTAAAFKRYNNIMMYICVEHKTIGTRFSEDTEGWNLRDLVEECEYWLSCYSEWGNAREELKHEDYDAWEKETGRLIRFINRYKAEAMTMEANGTH